MSPECCEVVVRARGAVMAVMGMAVARSVAAPPTKTRRLERSAVKPDRFESLVWSLVGRFMSMVDLLEVIAVCRSAASRLLFQNRERPASRIRVNLRLP